MRNMQGRLGRMQMGQSPKTSSAGPMEDWRDDRNNKTPRGGTPSLLVWSSPSTKGAGAYQLWENYKDPVADIVPNLTILRGHDSEDSIANPQMKLDFKSVLWACKNLRNILEKTGTTHVVTSISQADILYGLIVRFFSKAKWTIYVLGQPYPIKGQTGQVKRMVWRRLWLIAARRSDQIIAVSDYIAKIISADLGNQKIETIYPSLNDHRKLSNSIERSASSMLRVGFAGRLSPEKDPDLFCRIMNGFPDAEAKIYGDGPLRHHIEKFLDQIQFFGFRPQEEIYSGVDILMMTSKSEGLPMVLVEASYTGVVPLVADVGGCAEAIHPDNRAVLVISKEDRHDVATWRARLHILKDMELRQEIARRQLEWATLMFDAQQNSRSLARLVILGDAL